jgi:diguanylate cyclase (GGDEF)-like protein
MKRRLLPMPEYFRHPVNVFSPIILVAFLLILVWIGHSRQAQFVAQHKLVAQEATKTAASEIEDVIASVTRLTRIFVEDHHERITALANAPDNDALRETIDDHLKRFFPDYFAFSIADAYGAPIIDDFDGYVGRMCIEDMRQSIRADQTLIRVHPNPYIYHTDIMVRFESGTKDMIFLVSFDVENFAKVLQLSSPESHTLTLIQPQMDNIIEITESGGRNHLINRDDFHLSDAETRRVLSRRAIPGTLWEVIDMHNPNLFRQYRTSLFFEGAIIYTVFVIIVTIMWVLVLRVERRRQQAQKALMAKTSEISRLNDDLQILSVTDELTGLKNRRYLNTRLSEEWNRSYRNRIPLAFAAIDIDYFKQYNDTYGHQAGDECIKEVAKILAEHFRRATEFVARYGGEEFAVVTSGDDREAMVNTFEELRAAVENKQIAHENSQVARVVTVSIGVAYGTLSEQTRETDILKLADQALYDAKRAGRNRLVFKDF